MVLRVSVIFVTVIFGSVFFVYGFLPLSVRKLGNSFEVVLVSFSTFSSGVSEMFE